MMSAKLATLGLLKIMVSWFKYYDVIIPVQVNTKKVLSRNLNYIVDVVTWPKFGNSTISVWEVIISLFLRGGLGTRSIIWDWR